MKQASVIVRYTQVLTVWVVQEAGFSFVELNASDTRSKKSLQQEVAATLDNTTLTDFYGQTLSMFTSRQVNEALAQGWKLK